MIITYFIGNGFDKALALNTGYKDFYNNIKDIDLNENIEFRKQNQYTQNIIQDIMNEMCDDNKENWSDFEVGIIEYLNKQSNDFNVDNFINALSFFSGLLHNYLELEYLKFKKEKTNINFKKIKDQILYPFDECERMIKDGFDKLFASDVKIIINFLTFNYTWTLEDIIDGQFNFPYTKYYNAQRVTLLDPIHLHGDLNNNMLIGIDSIEQINNEIIRKKFIGKEYYIEKPSMNKILHNAVINNSKDNLFSSQLVVIFGSSLGITDSMWWKVFGKWYNEDKNRKILLFHYLDQKVHSSNYIEIIQIRDAVASNLLKKMGIEGKYSSESERISIIINTEYFLKNIINDVKEEVKK